MLVFEIMSAVPTCGKPDKPKSGKHSAKIRMSNDSAGLPVQGSLYRQSGCHSRIFAGGSFRSKEGYMR